jgi:cytochrome b6-f complex iron-sulfur subunit
MTEQRKPVPVARRRFVRTAALGAAGAVLALLGAGFAAVLWPKRVGRYGSIISVAAADVPAVNAPPFRSREGKFYLVHNEDGLLALSWRCTHKGCTTPWIGPVESQEAFRCPCHGSSYTYSGVRTGGPAPRPFDLMRLAVNGDGSVAVDTSVISSRSGYSPDQAAPYPA